MIFRTITALTATLCAVLGIYADDQVVRFDCPEPYLEIDVADPGQLQMLEREFVSYEACFIDYAKAISEQMNARKAAIDTEVPEDSWTEEKKDEQIRAIDAAINDLEAYRAALVQSRMDFHQVVRAILEIVPAKLFNQWGAETKVAEP